MSLLEFKTKQYVVFSEDSPQGEVVEARQLGQFKGVDGFVYEIGQKVGNLIDLAEECLEKREKEE